MNVSSLHGASGLHRPETSGKPEPQQPTSPARADFSVDIALSEEAEAYLNGNSAQSPAHQARAQLAGTEYSGREFGKLVSEIARARNGGDVSAEEPVVDAVVDEGGDVGDPTALEAAGDEVPVAEALADVSPEAAAPPAEGEEDAVLDVLSEESENAGAASPEPTLVADNVGDTEAETLLDILDATAEDETSGQA